MSKLRHGEACLSSPDREAVGPHLDPACNHTCSSFPLVKRVTRYVGNAKEDTAEEPKAELNRQRKDLEARVLSRKQLG